MMDRRTYVLKDRATRRDVAVIVSKLDLGTRIEIKGRSRTDDQNRALWSLLTQIQRQRPTHNGVTMTPELWKAVFLNALGTEMRMMPNLEGNGFFPLSYSSSRLTVSEFSGLITVILAWADQEGIALKHFDGGRAEGAANNPPSEAAA